MKHLNFIMALAAAAILPLSAAAADDDNLLIGWDGQGYGSEDTPEDAGWLCTDDEVQWSTPLTGANYEFAHYRDNLGVGRAFIHPQNTAVFAFPTQELKAGVTYILTATLSGMNKEDLQYIGISSTPDLTGKVCIECDEISKWSGFTGLETSFECPADGNYYFVWQSDLEERSVIWDIWLEADPNSVGGITSISVNDSAAVDVYNIMGVRVKSQVSKANALDGLSKGIYIVGGKKVVK